MVWIFVWHSNAEKIKNGSYIWFFLLLKKFMNNNCYGSSSSSCVVLFQHYKMFKSHMLTHGSCAMVFVIHNQYFPILVRSFSYNFLLGAMTHNTLHSLRFRIIYNSNMVINLKKCSCIYCSTPNEQKNLVVLQFYKQLFIMCLFFSL
jgi:hypothetical protein